MVLVRFRAGRPQRIQVATDYARNGMRSPGNVCAQAPGTCLLAPSAFFSSEPTTCPAGGRLPTRGARARGRPPMWRNGRSRWPEMLASAHLRGIMRRTACPGNHPGSPDHDPTPMVDCKKKTSLVQNKEFMSFRSKRTAHPFECQYSPHETDSI